MQVRDKVLILLGDRNDCAHEVYVASSKVQVFAWHPKPAYTLLPFTHKNLHYPVAVSLNCTYGEHLNFLRHRKQSPLQKHELAARVTYHDLEKSK
jgi:hypothetical protein